MLSSRKRLTELPTPKLKTRVVPAYFFNGDTPKAGETYRAALARSMASCS